MIGIVGMTREDHGESSIESIREIDPTPEQIAVRAATIRAGWSDKQRESRRVTKARSLVNRTINVNDWAAGIASALSN